MQQITKKSTSNIALVKYWGKKNNQIPMNPSISMTLKHAYTETTIDWNIIKKNSDRSINFLFENKKNELFKQRISKFIDQIINYIPVLENINLNIESHNSFPHSSGIASSASAMSALALCLVGIEKQMTGSVNGFSNELQKASFISRFGSGSATRSIYPGFTLWGKTEQVKNSSNEYAIAINNDVHSVFKQYNDAILIVSDKSKKVSSSIGHSLMNNHPFADNKFREALINTEKLLNILKNGEQMEFCNLVETEALLLHAMMLSSNPSFILMEPNTLQIIQQITNFRNNTKIPVCFTLDAGANVHLLYPNNESNKIKPWIETELTRYCTKQMWIDDCVDLIE